VTTENIEPIEAAYELGRAHERAKMAELARIRGAHAITRTHNFAGDAKPAAAAATKATSAPTSAKAPKVARGVRKAAGPRTKGVKEAIMAYLGDHPLGDSTIEGIIKTHGFKENSVRGTLMTLKKTGIIRQDGKFWMPANMPSGNSGAEAAAHTD
jgi:hypothetical protein